MPAQKIKSVQEATHDVFIVSTKLCFLLRMGILSNSLAFSAMLIAVHYEIRAWSLRSVDVLLSPLLFYATLTNLAWKD